MLVPSFRPVYLRLPLSAVAALADVMARALAMGSRRRPAADTAVGYGFKLRAPTMAAKLRAALAGRKPGSDTVR